MMHKQEQEDNIIRQKIENLNRLPEGYAPSMESKWTLLEAGLVKKDAPKKYKHLVWWMGAAALWIVLGVWWVKSSVSLRVKPATVSTASQPTDLPEYKQPEEKITQHQSSDKREIDKEGLPAAPKKAIHSRVTTVLPETESRNAPQELEEEKIASLPLSRLEDSLSVAIKESALSPIAKKSTRTKSKRFIEIDFGQRDTSAIGKQPSVVAKESNVIFRLKLGGTPAQNNSPSPESSMKLMYEF